MLGLIKTKLERIKTIKAIIKKDCIYTLNYQASQFVSSGDFSAAKALIRYRNSRFGDTAPWVDFTPLMKAVSESASIDVVKNLVLAGDPVNGVCDGGHTAIDFAFKKCIHDNDSNHVEVFKYLVNHSGLTIVETIAA